MPWGVFAAVLLLVYLLQTSVVGFFHTQAVDLFLCYGLVWALIMPTQEARLGAWIIGLTQDLGGDGAVGIHAVALGLTAIVLTRLRGSVNQYFWGARLLIGSVSALPGQLLLFLHQRFVQRSSPESWWQMIGSMLLISLIAAAVAALLTHWLGALGWWDRGARRYPAARRW